MSPFALRKGARAPASGREQKNTLKAFQCQSQGFTAIARTPGHEGITLVNAENVPPANARSGREMQTFLSAGAVCVN